MGSTSVSVRITLQMILELMTSYTLQLYSSLYLQRAARRDLRTTRCSETNCAVMSTCPGLSHLCTQTLMFSVSLFVTVTFSPLSNSLDIAVDNVNLCYRLQWFWRHRVNSCANLNQNENTSSSCTDNKKAKLSQR